MRVKNLLFLVLIILIFLLPRINAIDSETEENVEDFIEGIINKYNRKIFFREYPKNEKESNEFEFNQQYFTFYLHEGKGVSFNVSYFNSNKTNWFVFVVTPIATHEELEVYYDEKPDYNKYHTMLNISSLSGDSSQLRGNRDFRFEIPKYDYYIFAGNINKIINDTEDYADYKAEWIYQEDLKYIEQQKIYKIWKPFTENYTDIIYHYDYLLDTNLNEIKYNISENIINIYLDNGYTYESFLEDFIPFNRTIHHYIDLQDMIYDWNNFKKYTSLINFCISCYQEINTSYYDIEYNIYNNESYLYTDFFQEKVLLNQSVQTQIHEQVKNLLNWIYSIVFFVINLVVFFYLAYKLCVKKIKEEIKFDVEYLVTAFAVVISVLWSIFLTIQDADLIQKVIPLGAIIIPYFYYKYLVKTN